MQRAITILPEFSSFVMKRMELPNTCWVYSTSQDLLGLSCFYVILFLNNSSKGVA